MIIHSISCFKNNSKQNHNLTTDKLAGAKCRQMDMLQKQLRYWRSATTVKLIFFESHCDDASDNNIKTQFMCSASVLEYHQFDIAMALKFILN